MSQLYSKTNRIRFSDIPEKYDVPRQFRSKLSEVHSAVITYVYEHFKDSQKYKQRIVDALNILTFCIMQNEPPPFNWSTLNPLDTMPDFDLGMVEDLLGKYYLTIDSITWDVSCTNSMFSDTSVDVVSDINSAKKDSSSSAPFGIRPFTDKPTVQGNNSVTKSNVSKVSPVAVQVLHDSTAPVPTPKEDLYIQPPRYPRFDVNNIWMSASINGDNLVIYSTLPEVPTKQNEISITTNVDKLTQAELLNLYPNHVIHTRAQQLYERYLDLDYDDDLGCILPIGSFSKEELIDNLIKYPHLYRLRKINEAGKLSKFFSTIEIDGELVPITDAWDTLPESKFIPREPEYIKEYVIRRYLLERDSGVSHKYNLFGTLEPFLTLFMPPYKYAERGYSDPIQLAKQCVTSRVHYKQSRSPILRRLEQNV